MSESETITIKRSVYNKLVKKAIELRTLESWGVDNWEGYGEAMAELYGSEDDEDEDDK